MNLEILSIFHNLECLETSDFALGFPSCVLDYEDFNGPCYSLLLLLSAVLLLNKRFRVCQHLSSIALHTRCGKHVRSACTYMSIWFLWRTQAFLKSIYFKLLQFYYFIIFKLWLALKLNYFLGMSILSLNVFGMICYV